MSEFPIPEELRAGHWSWDIGESLVGGHLDDPDLGRHIGLALSPSGYSKKWATVLRDLTRLKYLSIWTGYSTQLLFDSVATITSLERLAFGNLRAADISGLANLRRLKYLSITSLSSASTLKPIAQLKDLISLCIGVSGKIMSLEDFSENSLHSLRALHLGESAERVITLDSLEPLGTIQSLEYLAIGRVRSKDKSLATLLKLPHFRALEIDKNARFCSDDIVALRSKGVVVSTF